MNDTMPNKRRMLALMIAATVVALPGVAQARDRGVNQPGAVGNAGPAGKDPGINQPGAAGNVKPDAKDPGVNQPGEAGNVKA